MAKRSKPENEADLIRNLPSNTTYYLKDLFPHVSAPSSLIVLPDIDCLNANEHECAFTRIYNEFYPYAFFVAREYVPSADVADIVASVFCKLWLKKEKLPFIEHIKAYIRTSVRNACIDFNQDASFRRIEDGYYAEHFMDADEGEFMREARKEKLDLIYTQIEALPPSCRKIFKLAWLEEKTNAEIASLLSITDRTVRNQKSKALKLLRMGIRFLVIAILFLS